MKIFLLGANHGGSLHAFYLSTDLPKKALDSSLDELLVEACISLPKKALDRSLYDLLLEVCISLETDGF